MSARIQVRKAGKRVKGRRRKGKTEFLRTQFGWRTEHEAPIAWGRYRAKVRARKRA